MNLNKLTILSCIFNIIFSTHLFSQEICNNGIDDDDDGLVDCYDPDCFLSGNCNDFYLNKASVFNQANIQPLSNEFDLVSVWETSLDQLINLTSGFYLGTMNPDEIPDVVTLNSTGATGIIQIFNGQTGELSFSIAQHGSSSTLSQFCIADVDENGYGDIFVNEAGIIRRYEYGSNSFISEATIQHNSLLQTPQIADFNFDGIPEIYICNAIYNSLTLESIITYNTTISQGVLPQGVNNIEEAFSLAYDIFQEGDVNPNGGTFGAEVNGLELIVGNEIYAVDFTNKSLILLSKYEPTADFNTEVKGDGFVSLGDVTGNGKPEVIVSTLVEEGAKIYIWSPYTQTLVSEYLLNGKTKLSKAAVGDINGDGSADLVVTSVNSLYVITYDNTNNLALLYKEDNIDLNAGLAGVSLFDFDGNNSLEILLADDSQLSLKGWDPSNTTVKTYLQQSLTNQTRAQYPLIADINGDGYTEIITGESINGVEGKLKLLRPYNQAFVNTRQVWNQSNYLLTNINDDLSIPTQQQINSHSYFQGKLNSYSAQSNYYSVNMDSLHRAPDLILHRLISDYQSCNDANEIKIELKVRNVGNWKAPAGYPIVMYNGNPFEESDAILLDTLFVNEILAVGDSTTVVGSFDYTSGNEVNLYFIINHNPYESDGSLVTLPLERPNLNTFFYELDYENNISQVISFNSCDIPIMVNLDIDNSSGKTGGDYEGSYFVGNEITGSVSDVDIRLYSIGNDLLNAVSIFFTDTDGIEASDSLIIRGNLPSGIGLNNPNDFKRINLTGIATIEKYEQAIKQIFFTNSALTSYDTRQISVVAQLTPTSPFNAPVKSYIVPKSRPTSASKSTTIDQDELYTFSLIDFSFNTLDDFDFDGIKISLPDPETDYRGYLIYDGDTVSNLELKYGVDISDVTKLQFAPYPFEYGSPLSRFNFRVKDSGGDNVLKNYSTKYDYVFDVNNLADPPISRDTVGIVSDATSYDQLISDFIPYHSYDNSPFQSLIVTQLPLNGTLQYDSGSGFVAVIENAEIPSSATLRYNPSAFSPTTNTNSDALNWGDFTFKVKDSQSPPLTSVDENTCHLPLLVTTIILDFTKEGTKNDSIQFLKQDFDDHYFALNSPALEKIIVRSLPSEGGELYFNTSVVTIDQEILYSEIETGKFHFLPDSFYNGTSTFKYNIINVDNVSAVADATITLNITNDRHIPIANDVNSSTYVNAPITVDPLYNDTDDDGDELFILQLNSVTNGTAEIVNEKEVVFTPTAFFEGQAEIEYEVTDKLDGTATATIFIDVINDIPVLSDITFRGETPDTVYFNKEAFEKAYVDMHALQKIRFESLPDVTKGTLFKAANQVVLQNEEFTLEQIDNIFYVPISEDPISDTFLWNGNDGVAFSTTPANVLLELEKKTYPPVAVDDYATTDVITPVEIDVLANDYDPEGDPLEITFVQLDKSDGSQGSIEIIGDVPDQKVLYTPNSFYIGKVWATYEITDNKDGTDNARIEIDVSPLPDTETPVVSDFTYITGENTSLTFSPFDFEENFSDPQGNALYSIIIEELPINGVLTFKGTSLTPYEEIPYNEISEIIYTPNTDYNGQDVITWNGSNGTVYAKDFATLTIQVILDFNPIKPVVSSFSKDSKQNESLSIPLSDFEENYDHSLDSIMNRIRFDILPTNGVLTVNDDTVALGDAYDIESFTSVIYHPNQDFSGEDLFHWNAKTNGFYAEDNAQVIILTAHELEIYNAFTPNGDNINDYWHIKDIEYYPNNEVYIFDKWGGEVFKSIGYDNSTNIWVGKSNQNTFGGNDLPAGTYYYKVDLKDGSEVRTGFVTIVK